MWVAAVACRSLRQSRVGGVRVGALASAAALSTTPASPADEVFEKLLRNVISRHDQDKASVYKSLLDMHEDNHFRLDAHQADLAFARLGDQSKPVNHLDPHALALMLLARKVRRGSLYFDRTRKRLVPSDSMLQPLADLFSNDTLDFDQHEAVFIEVGRKSKALMAAFVWRTDRGQAIGGVRLAPYGTVEEFIRDGFRLSLTMGRKAAAGDIWAGGGAGIVARPPGSQSADESYRKSLFQDYGEFLTSLRGCFVAGEDTGLSMRDLDWMHSRSRFVTCVSPSIGGTGKPASLTAAGVVSAMESALSAVGMGTLAGKSVALQGAGSIGENILRRLLQRDVARVVVVDTNAALIDRLKRSYEGQPVEMRAVKENDLSILAEPCDILSPNAIGGVLNAATIPTVRAKLVCGGANNQLAADPQDARLLAERGIAFVPDYIASRLGLVAAAWEPFGLLGENDPVFERHLNPAWSSSIPALTQRVFAEAKASGLTTCEVAARIANARSREAHPMIASRTESIIAALINGKWHQRASSKP